MRRSAAFGMRVEAGNDSLVAGVDVPSGRWEIQLSRPEGPTQRGAARDSRDVAGQAIHLERDFGGSRARRATRRTTPDRRRARSAIGGRAGWTTRPAGVGAGCTRDGSARSVATDGDKQKSGGAQPGLRPPLAVGGAAPEEAPLASVQIDAAGASAFYVNGWQSWSYSGTLQAGQRQPRERTRTAVSCTARDPGGPHATAAGEFRIGPVWCPASSIAEGRFAGGFPGAAPNVRPSAHVRLQSDASWLELVCPADGIVLGPSASLASDWACLQLVDLTEDLCLDPYLLAVAKENGARGDAASPTGWCSWYQFFARVQNDRLTQNEGLDCPEPRLLSPASDPA